MRVQAYLIGPADGPDQVEAVAACGFSEVLVGGDDPAPLARAAAEAGLAVAGLIYGGEGEVPETWRALADELGAWTVLRTAGPPRAALVAGAAPGAAVPPDAVEAYLWGDDAGADPGAAKDDELFELAEFLVEGGFEGGLALRGEGPGRLGRLKAVVTEVTAAGASWWDGSEDGY